MYYLKGHQKDYRWALFLHEEHHKCDIIPGGKGKPLKYYHMLIWFRQKVDGHGRYFSNVPFMQFIRRLYKKYNEACYPVVHELYDIEVQIKRLVRSKHRLITNASEIHESFKHLLEEEQVCEGITNYFYYN